MICTLLLLFLLAPRPGLAAWTQDLGSIDGDPGQFGLALDRWEDYSYGAVYDSSRGNLYAFIFDNTDYQTYTHLVRNTYDVNEVKAIGLPGLDGLGHVFLAYVQRGYLEVVRVSADGSEDEKATLAQGIDGYYAIAGITREKEVVEESYTGEYTVHVDVFDPAGQELIRYTKTTGRDEDWTSQSLLSLPGVRSAGQIGVAAYRPSGRTYVAWFKENDGGLYYSTTQSDETILIDESANYWADLAMDLTSVPHLLYINYKGAAYYWSDPKEGDDVNTLVMGASDFIGAAIAAYGERKVQVVYSTDGAIYAKCYSYGRFKDVERLTDRTYREAQWIKAAGSTRMACNYSWLAYAQGRTVIGDMDY